MKPDIVVHVRLLVTLTIIPGFEKKRSYYLFIVNPLLFLVIRKVRPHKTKFQRLINRLVPSKPV